MTTAEVETVQLDDVFKLAQCLSPKDMARLVVKLAPMIEEHIANPEPAKPMQLLGIWSDFALIPTEEDIADVRREMWQNFPREDV